MSLPQAEQDFFMREPAAECRAAAGGTPQAVGKAVERGFSAGCGGSGRMMRTNAGVKNDRRERTDTVYM